MKQRRRSAREPTPQERSTFQIEHLLLAAVTALLVLAALVPSESAARGTGATWAMLSMVVLSATAVLLAMRRQATALTAIDVAALLLGLWITLSAVLRAWQGDPRATWNSTWHWLAILANFWLVRQLFTTSAARRALLAVMLALSTGLAAHGLYQFTVIMPQNRLQYRTADEGAKRQILRDAGIDPDPFAPERRHFEDRLESTEPYATYGLANSLAGVLAAWWIVLIWLQLTPASTGMSPARRWALACCALLVLACLVLTKSRAAWLAAGSGFVMLCWAHRGEVLHRRRWLVGGFAALLVILLAGIVSGALDRQILTEAWISVTYRFEYWRAATSMLVDHPLFGCGPGNFQDYYTQYKLPTASETVADPHQLFLEVAATAGFPALLAVAFVALAALRRWWQSTAFEHAASPQPADASFDGKVPWAIYIGALLAALLAVPYGLLVDIPPEISPQTGMPVVWMMVVPVAIIALLLLHPWVQQDSTDALAMPLTAWVVMTINLLAAGGISYAGVAISWWLPLALSCNALGALRTLGNRQTVSLIGGSLLLLIGCAATAYFPVIRAQEALRRGAAATSSQSALDAYQQAADADRWSADPPRMASELLLMEWLATDQDATYRQFEKQLLQAADRSRHSHTFAMHCGRVYLLSYRSGRRPDDVEKSLQWYQQAVALYPNSNYAHAQLAWVAHIAGRSELAVEHAQRALQLDAINPHAEQQLVRRRLIDPGPAPGAQGQVPPPPAGINAEPLMQQLRTGQRTT